MRVRYILQIVGFFLAGQLSAQSGMVEIKVYTNVNQFTCLCTETSFICAETLDHEKVLKLPVSSFSCPKRKIDKDLIELFEAEKYPYISIEIMDYKIQNRINSAEVKITIKETEKVYQLQLEKIIEDENYYFKGKQQLDLTDYHIEPPVKVLGLVKVKPIVDIEFKIPDEFVTEEL